jgi:hypothetical protein
VPSSPGVEDDQEQPGNDQDTPDTSIPAVGETTKSTNPDTVDPAVGAVNAPGTRVSIAVTRELVTGIPSEEVAETMIE